MFIHLDPETTPIEYCILVNILSCPITWVILLYCGLGLYHLITPGVDPDA